MKTLPLLYVVFLAILCQQCSTNPLDEWELFKVSHNKQYSSAEEEAYRRSVFEHNLDFINRHNEKASKGIYTFTLGINEFADLESNEFQSMMYGYRRTPSVSNGSLHRLSGKTLPKSVDWRERNVVAPVKNQGSCGSCWAFSAIASTESALAIKNKASVVELSEQNLVDCSTKEGNMGCNGGMMDFAFKYMEKYGIDSEKSYPYEGHNGKCRFHNDTVVVKVANYKDIPKGDEQSLLDAVANHGPVSVAVHATFMMQFYRKGILKDPFCQKGEKMLNHGITVVGYGSENGKGYYIVKNSWGSTWGEHGYLRMAQGSNQCGIATDASYPIV